MKKRIALVGNMNNNFFAITRYLRDMGYDAHLFYRLGMEHFRPKADTYKLDYADYCHEVGWLKTGFHNVDETEVKRDLQGFDFYIGQADEAAVAYSCGFGMDVYYPYGTDVSKYAYLPQEYSIKSKLFSFIRSGKNGITYAQMKKGTLSKFQRGVIVNAKHILAEYTNEEFIKELDGLHYKGEFAPVPMPFLYTKEYDAVREGYIPDVHWKSEIEAMRAANDFVILYHGRQEWKSFYHKFNSKNTHHLIIGFAEYVKRHPEKKACLAMLEYGNDVVYSKQLIEELGIAEKVKWFPQMYRKDIMYLLKNVDICTGEFDKSYLTFGTVVEAMIMGKTVIHHREDRLYTGIYPELYPMLQAKTPEEIAEAITYAADHTDALRQMGEASRKWMMKHFIDAPLAYLVNIIEGR